VMMNESSRESATRGAHGAGIDWIGLVAIDDAFVSFRFVSFRFVRSWRARGREGNRGVTISSAGIAGASIG